MSFSRCANAQNILPTLSVAKMREPYTTAPNGTVCPICPECSLLLHHCQPSPPESHISHVTTSVPRGANAKWS